MGAMWLDIDNDRWMGNLGKVIIFFVKQANSPFYIGNDFNYIWISKTWEI